MPQLSDLPPHSNRITIEVCEFVGLVATNDVRDGELVAEVEFSLCRVPHCPKKPRILILLSENYIIEKIAAHDFASLAKTIRNVVRSDI